MKMGGAVMRKLKIFIFSVLIIALIQTSLWARWQQDGGSLNNNTSHNSNFWNIVMSNDTPYVAWHEDNYPSGQVYVKYLNGNNWVQDGSSLNMVNTGSAYSPSLAIYNGAPYVAWGESNGTPNQIYVKHLNGGNWVQDGVSLNAVNTGTANLPSIAIFNGTPYVAWGETNVVTNQIYVKHLNGNNWVQDGGSLNVVNTGTANPISPFIMAHLMWHGMRPMVQPIKFM